MTVTKLASWQIDPTDSSTTISPFHFNILAEVSRAIIQATEWVEESSDIDLEYWKRYRTKVSTAVENNWTSWNDCPDDEFGKLWICKYHALNQLYTEINTLYIKYGIEPYQAEIYREKFDQAIDWTTSSDPDTAAYPLLKAESEVFNTSMDDVASNILKKRAFWINMMANIERVRLFTKSMILHTLSTPTTVDDLLKTSIKSLQELDTSWT